MSRSARFSDRDRPRDFKRSRPAKRKTLARKAQRQRKYEGQGR